LFRFSVLEYRLKTCNGILFEKRYVAAMSQMRCGKRALSDTPIGGSCQEALHHALERRGVIDHA